MACRFNMDPNYRIDSITKGAVQELLREYPAVVSEKLHALDEARYESIPTALASRDNASLTKPEVARLVEWKLSHGTFRPTLKKLVDQNSDDDIASTTRDGFDSFAQDPHANIKSSLTKLTELKGIGPATASLLLSVYDPAQAPFFSDELFRWVFWEDKKGDGWDRKFKYTPKEYLELFEKIQQAQKRLEGVKAVELEKVAYVLGKRAAGRSEKTDMKLEDKSSLKSDDKDLKRKAKSEADSEPKSKEHKTKKAKVSKSVDKEPTKGTRTSARVKERDVK